MRNTNAQYRKEFILLATRNINVAVHNRDW